MREGVVGELRVRGTLHRVSRWRWWQKFALLREVVGCGARTISDWTWTRLNSVVVGSVVRSVKRGRASEASICSFVWAGVHRAVAVAAYVAVQCGTTVKGTASGRHGRGWRA